jgi:hypothetical protein
VAQFVIARNPEQDSRLPYLLWVPLGQRGLLFKAAPDSFRPTADVD